MFKQFGAHQQRRFQTVKRNYNITTHGRSQDLTHGAATPKDLTVKFVIADGSQAVTKNKPRAEC